MVEGQSIQISRPGEAYARIRPDEHIHDGADGSADGAGHADQQGDAAARRHRGAVRAGWKRDAGQCAPGDLRKKTDKSRTISAVLLAQSWQTDPNMPFYVYKLAVEGVTAASNQDVLLDPNITAAQLTAAQAANIQDGGQIDGELTLKAWGYKPTVDIPIRVILRGDT